MIRDNLSSLKGRITAACARIKRDPATITMVAVSKGRTAQEVYEAIQAGITDIGENRVQEALIKYNDKRLALGDMRIRWHMVGHLQTNKVKEAVRIFDLVHSVDSIRLAAEIDKQAARVNKVQDILIEVKTSPEATKSGLNPEELAAMVEEAVKLKNINIKGLMTIAPVGEYAEQPRPYFRMLRELKEKINPSVNNRLTLLSMGMTDDFEVAIEEGADIIRLGRAIFGGF